MPGRRPRRSTRRQFLGRALPACGLSLVATPAWLEALAAQAPCTAGPSGELIRTLPLYGPGAREAPLGQMVGGAGLDARLFTDLSGLDGASPVTPTAAMFVRTAAPRALPADTSSWSVALGKDQRLTTAELRAASRDMGVHLIECAGNSNPQNFGLMSAVRWDGVPLAMLTSRLHGPRGRQLLVTGLDDDTSAAGGSEPGASWILPEAAVSESGAFLATAMNGEPLTRDHGAPVRLVVPGWYGCSWIKWVQDLRWVDADAPSTAQMREYARRTHQDGVPALARDYEAPAVDTAAMPIRVEQRRVDGKVEYRVVGIVWGGAAPVDRFVIRFGSRDAGTPIQVCPAPLTTKTWAIWDHRWQPSEPGFYDISLRAADPAVRTRRLDLSFYIRRVRIDEV